MCTFPQARSKFLNTHASNNIACFGRSIGCFTWFPCFQDSVFFFLTPKKTWPEPWKKGHFGGPFFESAPKTSQSVHSEAPFRVLEGSQRIRASGPPCRSDSKRRNSWMCVRTVSPGQYFRTIHDLDDGIGGSTGACREFFTTRRLCLFWARRVDPWTYEDQPSSSSHRITYHSEQFGIEIQVQSMRNDGSLSWIMISRGMNTYVEEINEEKG